MKCVKCGFEVASNMRDCMSCGTPNGYPNIRMADTPEEQSALANRLHTAEVSAKAGGYESVLSAFGVAVLQSKATLSRSLSEVSELFSSDFAIYTTHAKRVRQGSLGVSEDQIDRQRAVFEAQMFPSFHEEIRFASLSLDGTGLQSWGLCSMVLKSPLIEDRASVFEENCMIFSTRHGITAVLPIPAGYRAIWKTRDLLAKAKLYSKINGATKSVDFPNILKNDTGDGNTSDFIEVHIYGPLTRNTVEEIVIRKSKAAPNRILIRELESRAKALHVGIRLL